MQDLWQSLRRRRGVDDQRSDRRFWAATLGTSLMMSMLAAGGIPILTDQQRRADEDNPQGYYEFERVKRLEKGDTGWLAGSQGKAVKVISALLPFLPPNYSYRVIFMERPLAKFSRRNARCWPGGRVKQWIPRGIRRWLRCSANI